MLTKNVKKRPNIFDVNLNLKNRDKPDTETKIRVFDFKKLLMMKPDIQKLDQMKKVNFYKLRVIKGKTLQEAKMQVPAWLLLLQA